MLAFLQTVQTQNTTLIGALAASYQLSFDQLANVTAWIAGKLLATTWLGVPGASAASVNATALGLFYRQWSDGSGIDPRGLDLNSDGIQPDGFELVGANTPSGFATSSVVQVPHTYFFSYISALERN